MNQSIVLGSRGSELALTQTELVEKALRARWPNVQIETKIIRTSGDDGAVQKEVRTTAAGRKGLFTAEIERALIEGTIDVAVHSAKDLPSALNDETDIAAVLPRAPLDDVLVSLGGYDLESLPREGVVATGSIRRRYQLRWARPDANVVDLRGNVPTRLRKLTSQQWDGAILARAGLQRLGYQLENSPVDFEGQSLSLSVLSSDIFVPAGGQGIIAMQIRADDARSRNLLKVVSDHATAVCLRAEREFLRLLHGDCNQPVGVVAILNGNVLEMRGQVFRTDAAAPYAATVAGNSEDAETLAVELLKRING
jgi:hydroxymethylbilane synthase